MNMVEKRQRQENGPETDPPPKEEETPSDTADAKGQRRRRARSTRGEDREGRDLFDRETGEKAPPMGPRHPPRAQRIKSEAPPPPLLPAPRTSVPSHPRIPPAQTATVNLGELPHPSSTTLTTLGIAAALVAVTLVAAPAAGSPAKPAPHPSFSGAWGFGDDRGATPGLTPETRFWIGSVAKQFTAATALRLAEAGSLDLDRPAASYLPELDDAALSRGGATCTVAQLLGHTCGLPEELTGVPCTLGHLDEPPRRACFLAALTRAGLASTPGERFAYSNVGYDLAGLILQEVSGLPYAELVDRELWAPLGMRSTGIHPTPESLATFARGQLYLLGLDLDASRWHLLALDAPARFGASGNVYSTVEDLMIWQRALHRGEVLSPAAYTRMTTPGLGDYGLGIARAERPFGTILWHTGALSPYGYNSFVGWLPERQAAIVALANRPAQISHSGRFAEALIVGDPAPRPSPLDHLRASLSALLLLSTPLLAGDLLRRIRRADAYPRAEWLLTHQILICALSFILVRFREPPTVGWIAAVSAVLGLLGLLLSRRRLLQVPWLAADRHRGRQLLGLAINAAVIVILAALSPVAIAISQALLGAAGIGLLLGGHAREP